LYSAAASSSSPPTSPSSTDDPSVDQPSAPPPPNNHSRQRRRRPSHDNTDTVIGTIVVIDTVIQSCATCRRPLGTQRYRCTACDDDNTRGRDYCGWCVTTCHRCARESTTARGYVCETHWTPAVRDATGAWHRCTVCSDFACTQCAIIGRLTAVHTTAACSGASRRVATTTTIK
jgi:hypothetical protein